MSAQHANVDVRCSSRDKPRLKKRRICYEKLSDLKNQLDEIVKKESSYNMIPHQCFVYAVISGVENPLKDNCYRVRIDDETFSDVLCRIEFDRTHPKVGPKMSLGDIIRIHRLTVQIEYDDEKRSKQMVFSTSPHHNYTIFKVYESGAIKYKSSANNVSFNGNDERRLCDIARWGRIKFQKAVIESLRVRYIIKETITSVQNCTPPVTVENKLLSVSKTRRAKSTSARVENESSSARVENESSSARVENESSSARVENESSSARVENESSSARVENESSSARIEIEQVIPEFLCNESETNTKLLQKSSKDSVKNSEATVSNNQNKCEGVSEIRKSSARLNNPEKVALFVNSKLSQFKQMSLSRSDQNHSFTKQSTKSSASVECNPGSSKSSKNKQNHEDVTVSAEILPPQITSITTGSDHNVMIQQPQNQLTTTDLDKALTKTCSVSDPLNNNQHQSNFNTSGVYVQVETVSNEKSDGQNSEDVNPVCSPLQTYEFICKIIDLQHDFEFEKEDRKVWLRILPETNQMPTFETERYSQTNRQNTVDILVNKVDSLSENDLQGLLEHYLNLNNYIQINNITLSERVSGSLPTFTMDGPCLVEQIRRHYNLLMNTSDSGDNVEDEIMNSCNQAMEFMHSFQEQDFEGSNNSSSSSYKTAMSSSNASLKSCLSQTSSLVDESGEITVLDADLTHIISHHNTSTSTDQNEDETITESSICLSTGVQGIDEIELASSSPESFIKNARVNIDREGEETETESLFPPDTSATNSQSESVVSVSSENEQLENLMSATLTESSSESVEEPSEMYHSGPPPKRPKLKFNTSSI